MYRFSLDTNCIYAIEEGRPEALALRELVSAHSNGTADVALVAISASERQRHKPLESFDEFSERIDKLDLGSMEKLKPMFYWDVTFWDFSFEPDDDWKHAETEIHHILFSRVEFLWPDYCAKRCIPVDDVHSDLKWKNAKCDVQAYWSHVYAARTVFVTSDGNFHKKSKSAALTKRFGGHVATPAQALQLLHA
jgi:hypothetical protein